MKVAICIIGQPRHFEETFQNIYKNIIKPNNADVFLHAWFNEEESNKTLKHAGVCYYKNKNKEYIVPKNTKEKLIQLYKPKDYLIEKQINFQKKKYSHLKHDTLFSMYYSLMKCHDLIRNYETINNFKYDMIIKIRYDVFCYEPIIANKFNNDFFNNRKTGSIDDRIWFSNSDNMYNISRVFLELDEYINNKHLRDKYIKNHDYTVKYKKLLLLKYETVLLYIVKKLGLKIHNFKYKYELFSRI